MKHYTIDCRRIDSRQTFHDVFSRTLRLPEWYGRNLDALHDCLTELSEDTYLMLLHSDALAGTLGEYGKAAAALLSDSAGENPHLFLILG